MDGCVYGWMCATLETAQKTALTILITFYNSNQNFPNHDGDTAYLYNSRTKVVNSGKQCNGDTNETNPRLVLRK